MRTYRRDKDSKQKPESIAEYEMYEALDAQRWIKKPKHAVSKITGGTAASALKTEGIIRHHSGLLGMPVGTVFATESSYYERIE